MSRAAEILVGDDGSAGSRSAVRWAAEEAALRSCGLLIVHAADPHSYRLWTSTRAVRDGLRELARPQVERSAALARLAGPGVPIRTRVMVARTTQALIMLSGDAVLTVVGHSGRTPISSTVLGSVAERVLACASSPVVAVPRHPHGAPRVPLERVVAAIDGPARHQATLRFAFEEASRHGAAVHLVHVADQGSTPLDLDPGEWIGEWNRTHPGVVVTHETRAGELLESVAAILRDSDLLVLGHHRAGLAPQLLGRHGRDLFRHARCPVAVVGESDPGAKADEAHLHAARDVLSSR